MFTPTAERTVSQRGAWLRVRVVVAEVAPCRLVHKSNSSFILVAAVLSARISRVSPLILRPPADRVPVNAASRGFSWVLETG